MCELEVRFVCEAASSKGRSLEMVAVAPMADQPRPEASDDYRMQTDMGIDGEGSGAHRRAAGKKTGFEDEQRRRKERKKNLASTTGARQTKVVDDGGRRTWQLWLLIPQRS